MAHTDNSSKGINVSTKIYNGMILRGCTLTQVLARLKEIRPACIANMQQAVAGEIGKRVVLYKDMAVNYCAIDQQEPDFWTVVDLMRDAKVSVCGMGSREPDWDYSFDICLIPHGGDVLALHYMENNAGYTENLKAAGFEDFHYQDQTDGPETITPEDWDQRRVAWNEALPGRTTPSEAGLTYSLVDWSDIAYVQHLHELWSSKVPTDEQRRQEVAARLTEMEITPNHGATNLLDLIKVIKKLESDRRPLVVLCESISSIPGQ